MSPKIAPIQDTSEEDPDAGLPTYDEALGHENQRQTEVEIEDRKGKTHGSCRVSMV